MSKEKTNPKPLVATSVRDIKAKLQASKDGQPVELPSGLVFLLKKPSISRLLLQDVFPSELIAAAIKMDSQQEMKPANREEYLQYLKVIDTVVKFSCVQPRVVETEEELDDDSILLSDVEDFDRVSIFMYAQMGVTPMGSFRSEQPDVQTGSSVSEIPGAPAK